MKDMIDLSQAILEDSPQLADWPATRRITRVTSTPAGGISVFFDQPLPDAWKWPSNPVRASENFQFTVWLFALLGGVWQGAGFVQMWQGREMGEPDSHAIPPILSVPPGDSVPGYVNLWGDPRHLWGPLSDYVPQPGDAIALMVSAGNGRMCAAVSPETGLSVAERSNVVTFHLTVDDYYDYTYPADVDPPVDPPVDTRSDYQKLLTLHDEILKGINDLKLGLDPLLAFLKELKF
jgi:hypothetical protein